MFSMSVTAHLGAKTVCSKRKCPKKHGTWNSLCGNVGSPQKNTDMKHLLRANGTRKLLG